MTSTYRQILRERAATSDAAFAEYVSDLVFPEHLREAERFANRHPKGIVLEPRGFAKTTLFMHRAARRIGVKAGAWRLGILTAVEGDAESRSGAIRRLVENPRFAEVFPWAQAGVVGSRWTDAAWTIRGVDLGKDSTCTAMGLRSVRAGPRLDELLADDMVGMQENATAAQRQKALETYLAVVDPMVVPDGIRWFLGTIWHEDDIYASLTRVGWPTLVRRAITDGASLWPAYWSLERLEAKRLEMGSALFDLQFQNDPSGVGGNIFKRDWFKYVERVPDGVRRVGVDLASSSKERSDYTSAGEMVEDSDGNLYVCGSYAERLDEGHRAWLTGLKDSAADSGTFQESPRLLWPLGLLPGGFAGATSSPAAPRPLTTLNIEATVFQSTFVREVLANTRLPAMAVHPDKDKVSRSRALAARYEAGKVFHLRGGPGLDAYEREAVSFPNGEHDDRVDAMVYAADLNPGTTLYWTTGRGW